MKGRALLGSLVAVVLLAGAVWLIVHLMHTRAIDPLQSRFEHTDLALDKKSGGTCDSAIVFVHGLDGGPDDTFQAPGSPSWPEIVKGDTRPFPGDAAPPLSTFAIYSLDYRRVYASETNLDEAAKQVATYLRTSGLFERHNHVWFVVHSLGGVILKRALLIYDREGRDRVLNRVAGVFNFGVPSQGSPLANLAEDDRAQVLLTVLGKNYRIFTDLQPERAAAYLGGLEDDWNDFLRKREKSLPDSPPYIYCAYELNKSFHLTKVVEKLYAQTCRDGNSEPMADSHVSMVKPQSQDSPGHLWIRDGIGRGSLRLARWPAANKTPGVESLAGVVTDYQGAHKEPPDDSMLLRVPEAITFVNAAAETSASHLLLRPMTYSGPNVAAVLRRIAEQNSCVLVTASADNRKISVGVSSATRRCKGKAASWTTCAEVSCPQ